MSDIRRPIAEYEREPLMRFGAAVRRHRMRAGLTQKRLAARVGVHEDTIARIERGERRTRRATVEAVALACAEERGINPASVVRALLGVAERVLAPDSAYQERIAARRLRRYRHDRNLHRQRQREAIWTMLHALDRLMDWVLWDEYRRGERDWLPKGHQLIGDPRQWKAVIEAAERAHRAEWGAPTLARVLGDPNRR